MGLAPRSRAVPIAAAVLVTACGARTVPEDDELPAARADGGANTVADGGRWQPDAGRRSDGASVGAPSCEADVAFAVPASGRVEPEHGVLRFEGGGFPERRSVADLYFLVDVSYSMDAELDTMRDSLLSIIEGVRCNGAADEPCVEDLWTGVGFYEERFVNRLPLQPDPGVTAAAMEFVHGSGWAEALFRSVACAADRGACPAGAGCAEDGVGCAGFRSEAARAVVVVTDEGNECTSCGFDSAEAAAERLRAQGVLVAGINAGGSYLTRFHLEELARRTGSFARGGRPLYFRGEDEDVAGALAQALDQLAARVPRRVTATLHEEEGDDGDALPFVGGFGLDTDTEACTDALPVEDADGDGSPETFPALLPDVPVCWRIVPRPAFDAARRSGTYRLSVRVSADGVPQHERSVCFAVSRPPG